MTRDEIRKLFPDAAEEQISALLSSHHSEMNKLKDDNKALKEKADKDKTPLIRRLYMLGIPQAVSARSPSRDSCVNAYDFARRNGLNVIGEYIDKAMTGKTDKSHWFGFAAALRHTKCAFFFTSTFICAAPSSSLNSACVISHGSSCCKLLSNNLFMLLNISYYHLHYIIFPLNFWEETENLWRCKSR